MRLQRVSGGILALILLALGANALLLAMIARAYGDVVAAQEHRRLALALSSELQRETELLVRMVRAYTATGEPRYLVYYYEIMAVRQGKSAMPAQSLPGAYWDEVVAGRREHREPADGSRRALADRMRALGYNERELGVLQRVLGVTASMNEIEQKAFAATQGLLEPDSDRYVPDGNERLEYATRLVHGARYNALKADLSHAVASLFQLLDERTGAEVARADAALSRHIALSIAAMALTIVLAVAALLGLHRHVLLPITRLARTADRLAAGDYAARAGGLGGVEELGGLGRTLDGMAGAIESDIARRTREQAELESARRQAVEATGAKSRFLAHMSHEMRTPMNAILGLAHLARRNATDARQQDYLAKIHTAARRLLEVINDLLDLSRIESGRMELARRPFDLEQLVADALGLVRGPAAEKGLALALDWQPSPGAVPRLEGDPVRLGQVLTNLLANAVRFTAQGHVVLQVALGAPADGRSMLTLVVRDTGIGLSPEQLAGLFVEFAQVHEDDARSYGGSGLGLAISRRIIEQMGGRIGASAAPGAGARFQVEVPLAAGLTEPQDASSRARSARPARLLLADVPGAPRDALVNTLLAAGALRSTEDLEAVDSVHEAAQAWAGARARGMDFEVLLLDPAIAAEPVAALRALCEGPDEIPPGSIVVMSMQEWGEWRPTAQALGVRGIVAKPPLPGTLRALSAGEPSLPEPWADGAASTAATDSLTGVRVLLVEDHPVNRQVIGEMLVAAGAEVEFAEHGQAALARLAESDRPSFSLVLLDLQMPLMDGYALARAIRQDAGLRHLPLVAVTAHAMAGERERCIAAGMQDHLSKPVDPQALLACVRAWAEPFGPGADPPGQVSSSGDGQAPIAAVPGAAVDPRRGVAVSGHGPDPVDHGLGALLALLRAGDNAARLQWRQMRGAWLSAWGEGRCRRIDDALAEFDFDRAASLIQSAAAQPPQPTGAREHAR